MRRQIPGLHSRHQDSDTSFDGVFLVRVEGAWYRWHQQKPFVEVRFVILEPQSFQDRSFFSRLYCTERALWKLHWFLRGFGYDADLLNRDQVSRSKGPPEPSGRRPHLAQNLEWTCLPKSRFV